MVVKKTGIPTHEELLSLPLQFSDSPYQTTEQLIAAVEGRIIAVAAQGKTITFRELIEQLSMPLVPNHSQTGKFLGRVLGTINQKYQNDSSIRSLKIQPGAVVVSEVHYTVGKGFYGLMEWEYYDEEELGFAYDPDIEWHRELFFVRNCKKVWNFFAGRRKRYERELRQN